MKTTKILLPLIIFALLISVASAQLVTTTPATVTAGSSATFTYTGSELPFNTTATYNWYWDDGTDNTTTTTTSTTHTYTTAATYTVRVIVYTPISVDNWNISSDWQQIFETANLNLIVEEAAATPTPAATSSMTTIINGNIIASIGLFAVLPTVLGAAVFIISIRAFSTAQTEDEANAIIASLSITIAVIVLTEICAYVIVLTAAAFG